MSSPRLLYPVLALTTFFAAPVAGQGVVTISTGLVTDALEVRAIPLLRLEVISASDDTMRIATGTDGRVDFDLVPGLYRVVSPDPVEFAGSVYRWDVEFEVLGSGTSLLLSHLNASVDAEEAKSAPSLPSSYLSGDHTYVLRTRGYTKVTKPRAPDYEDNFSDEVHLTVRFPDSGTHPIEARVGRSSSGMPGTDYQVWPITARGRALSSQPVDVTRARQTFSWSYLFPSLPDSAVTNWVDTLSFRATTSNPRGSQRGVLFRWHTLQGTSEEGEATVYRIATRLELALSAYGALGQASASGSGGYLARMVNWIRDDGVLVRGEVSGEFLFGARALADKPGWGEDVLWRGLTELFDLHRGDAEALVETQTTYQLIR